MLKLGGGVAAWNPEKEAAPLMPLRSDIENFALIKVVGVGGGGSNAVNRMIRAELMGVEFISVNTDAQALLLSDAPHKIRIGDKITRGLGAGADPSVGRKSAEDDSEKLYEALKEADMIFITVRKLRANPRTDQAHNLAYLGSASAIHYDCNCSYNCNYSYHQFNGLCNQLFTDTDL